MKVSDRKTKEEHVKISLEIVHAEDFRQYMALSRDSFPMALGRIAALCLDVLQSKKTFYSVFELDRVVQWPADRRQTFAKTLELVGWAVPETNSIVRLELPRNFIPRRPYRQRSALTVAPPVQPKSKETGQFISQDALQTKIKTRGGSPVVLIDMDGYAVENIDDTEIEVAPNAKRRSRRRKPIIV